MFDLSGIINVIGALVAAVDRFTNVQIALKDPELTKFLIETVRADTIRLQQEQIAAEEAAKLEEEAPKPKKAVKKANLQSLS